MLSGSINKDKSVKYSRRVWHALTTTNNYMAVVSFVGRVIRRTDCDVDANYTVMTGFSEDNVNIIKTNIEDITKETLVATNMYGDKNSTQYKNLTFDIKMKRLLLLGMELHVITDAFAHRAYGIDEYKTGDKKRDWIKIGDIDGDNKSEADDINVYPARFRSAGIVVKNVMNQCLQFDAKGAVKMKETAVIGSKQIVYNNPFTTTSVNSFKDIFILYKLYSYANANKSYDATFNEFGNELKSYSYE